MIIDWRIGVEVELLAPRGKSRLTLAETLAAEIGGADATVRPCFHPQAEPSLAADTPVFENLTLGFEAVDPQGGLIARCVDDLTLQEDLDREAKPKPGWWRIASDDARLLRLISRHADPAAELGDLLSPAAHLFGTELQVNEDGMVRLADSTDSPIAIAAPLPGERERACELVTPPIDMDHQARLEALLAPARALGFTAPAEGATHIHFDASELRDAGTLARLIHFLHKHRAALKTLFQTNPRCRRLGPWPAALLDLTARADFSALSWEDAAAELQTLELTKYCDVNLMNLIAADPAKDTLEVRIFPVWQTAEPILDAAAFFSALLTMARAPSPIIDLVSLDLAAFLKTAPLDDACRSRLLAQMEAQETGETATAVEPQKLSFRLSGSYRR